MHDDPRQSLKANEERYIYAVLHAHQVSAIMDSEPGTGAMVSRSNDGQMIVPALRVRGCVPIRGSSRRQGQDKGGRAALQAMIDHVVGGKPAYLAVDGPRGPRGRVHKGIAMLARQADAAVITIAPVPSRRWILTRAWDRLQIPKPLAKIDAYFGPPLRIKPEESLEDFCMRIQSDLAQLEAEHDPQEYAAATAK
ncbi:hypothetical protein FF011L_55320 [Roseimaritima multifibrata]|uniref:DUF374 domain-containing protein n=1 Tax=Roseimaritima multifibrata TaxID=1930274 RepID=A0A517MPB7_9BACT|nr:DUF374 domain-containing protein [Roseimaritima multifibrata]QDS96720.1 hypothetical protein FF011L_55320 [Roseimaritima multifibrata]